MNYGEKAMKIPKNAIKAWHFIGQDKMLRYSDKRKVIKGRTLSVKGPIELCANGLHGSKKIEDAFSYVNNDSNHYLCEVYIWGDLNIGNTKLAGRFRHCKRIIKWNSVWRLAYINYVKASLKGKHRKIIKELYKYVNRKYPPYKYIDDWGKLHAKIINLIYALKWGISKYDLPVPEKYLLEAVKELEAN